jgi:FkbH-like protein
MSVPPEAVRLVVWDLDDTFWGGTLSEQGIAWRAENAETVRELSRRGIINSICSKNDPAPVHEVLEQWGLRDMFVFPSISWDAKGPRLAALVEAVQLRPETILFIDDNPMNRAEAKHFVPGLQIADETIVPGLLDDPRLRGKPDPDMTRLAQYRLLERRHNDQAQAGGDTTAFLRESGITVCIEHDLEPHIDRAVELINRTNQLNFTKKRLPEDIVAARAELRALLANHDVQAGILRVHDRYGDYGYCGLYISLRNQRTVRPKLLHFAFSCRILGMGIETWLYQRLERPMLRVEGDVLTDVVGDRRRIDWVQVELPGLAPLAADKPKPLAYVLARGGCDMRALAHYFSMVSRRVVEEFAGVRDGKTPLSCSSILAVHAIRGVPEGLIADCAPLGLAAEDFTTLVARPPKAGPAVWLLNFTLEQPVPMLKHKASGALIPANIAGLRGPARRMLLDDPAQTGLDGELVAQLREKFEGFGLLPDKPFQQMLRVILRRAPPGVRVFVLLANDMARRAAGGMAVLEPMRARNAAIVDVAREFPAVELLAPADFMSAAEHAALERPHHYDRMVYFRMFQHIMARLEQDGPARTEALAASA